MIRQSKTALRVLGSALKLNDRPYKLNFYLTDICNFRCEICKIWEKKAADEMTTDEIRTFFRKNNHFSWIDITGGEIFLRKDIKEVFDIVLQECKDLSLLHFPTHGFFTQKVIDSAETIRKRFKGRLVVTVSLDGPRGVHNQVRGMDSWDNAVETFRLLDGMDGVDVYFGYTLSRHNVGNLEGMLSELEEKIPNISMNRIHLNLAQVSSHYYSNEDEKLLEDMDKIIAEIDYLLEGRKLEISPFFALETRFLKLLKRYARDGTHPMKRCAALNASVTVNPKGDVYPCLFFDRKLGSLRKRDFELASILREDEPQEMKKDILSHCPHCWSACEAYPSILSGFR